MISTAIAAINLWGVLAAAAFAFVFGGVYFGMLTPKRYAVAMGRAGEPAASPSPLFIVGPFVCNVVMIIATAILVQATGTATFAQAVVLGLVVAIGYLLPMCMMIAINPNFPKPFYYTALNAPYLLISGMMYAVILTLMA
ncbi:DUF1761 domain-containing protein [Pararhodobacter zhoushanensis]|uniref:DUF1761 domain-containing protein n=1 Tax=Pararhodobacter zhoushanensis TaxID=2479545 RepID=A0ABT3GWA9_9RHOB|nr:DUF1761 domain-containing protein [Pararhodobacter zhoushanensis]MCW1931770.1 DUF1761 domain-containing protein [Pararhodobacter zhoushanensis]